MTVIAALHSASRPAHLSVSALVAEAAATLAPLWPIATFAARSPWFGVENESFEAVAARWPSHMGESMLPFAAAERQALTADPVLHVLMMDELKHWLVSQEVNTQGAAPDSTQLAVMMMAISKHWRTADNMSQLALPALSVAYAATKTAASLAIDGHVIRWLKLYLGAPGASWSLPGAQRGLFTAWRDYSLIDPLLPKVARRALAKSATHAELALAEILVQLPVGTSASAFITAQLLALPGWAGALAYRAKHSDTDDLLLDYVALRAQTAWALGGQAALATRTPALTANASAPPTSSVPHLSSQVLGLLFLRAREQRYLQGLKLALDVPGADSVQASIKTQDAAPSNAAPLVQVVLCIDVRSEPLRRALEQQRRIETFGAAGFFGLAVQRQMLDGQHTHASCPVIVAPAFAVAETAESQPRRHYLAQIAAQQALSHSTAQIKQHPLGALSAPEITGLWQAMTLISQTLPTRLKQHLHALLPLNPAKPQTTPQLSPVHAAKSACSTPLPLGMTLAQQVGTLHGFLRSIGLVREFTALIVIGGHGSHSENNHYAAKLDCGACGGASGRFNAQIIAAIGNDYAVRAALADLGVDIPAETLFIAAEHITSLDQLALEAMPNGDISAATQAAYAYLLAILPAAQDQLQTERISSLPDHQHRSLKHEATRRASDWREVRPEWGLVNNAAFIIGPRALTTSANLQGRTFLHSYDWQLDTDISLLRGIIAGPATVTQWINLQYYASTTLPVSQGSGSKTTQTLTAGFGVMQGNGSDLLPGLPWQAVMRSDHIAQHEALRLRVIILAPEAHVAQLLASAPDLQRKVNNGWLLLSSQCPSSKKWSDWQ